MVPGKRTLVVVALTTTLVSCSSHAVPATTPTMPTEPLRIYATTATLPLVLDLTTTYSEIQPQTGFDTQAANYQSMLDLLLSGATPYFLSNHLSSQDLWAAPIGYDGIIIIVNRSVSITNITTEQIRTIYQGRSTNWQDLGGNQEKIVVFSREAGSGTRAEFERMIMGRRHTTANALVASSSEHMVDLVAQTPGGIGYVSVAHMNATVRPMSINGIDPSLENIRNHRYPLRSTIFVIGLGEPQDEYRMFIGWVQSPAGQDVVTRQYVPLN